MRAVFSLVLGKGCGWVEGAAGKEVGWRDSAGMWQAVCGIFASDRLSLR